MDLKNLPGSACIHACPQNPAAQRQTRCHILCNSLLHRPVRMLSPV